MQHICIKKLTIAGLLILSGLMTSVQADTLELLTGEIINGKILSMNGKTVLIYQKPDKIKVNRNKIKKITFISEDKTKPETKKPVTKVSSSKPKMKPKAKIVTTNNTAPQLRPKVKVQDQKSTKQATKPLPKIATQTLHPDQNTSSKQKTSTKVTNKITNVQKTPTEQTSVRKASNVPVIDYLTYINGSDSQNTYLGIYSNKLDDKNLSIYLPQTTPAKISFKLHAQKNGKIPPLYTAGSVVFADKNGNVISKTNPIVVDDNTFVEWFKNLNNIAGITGNKSTTIEIPKNTYVIKILGYRPGSKNNLVGYISNLKLDNKTISNTNKIK